MVLRNFFMNIQTRKISRGLLIFLVSMVMFTLVMALQGFLPFGDKTLLTQDLSGQYIEFMKGMKVSLFDQFFYNFDAGLGSDYISLYTYYLSSPFQWILLLFDNEYIYVAVTILTAVKISLACVTMDIFLQKRFSSEMKYVIFSFCYGYAAMGITYSQSLMWLDGIIMLPLILFGIEELLNEKKSWKFGLFVGLSILFNYYTAYMNCVFCIIYFFVRTFQLKIMFKATLENIKNAVLSGMLAVGTNAVFLIPSYLAIAKNRLTVDNTGFITDIFERLKGLNSLFLLDAPVVNEMGHSYIYSGVLVAVLFIAALIQRKQDLRLRIINYIFVGLMVLCVLVEPLNYVFHLFTSPFLFPTRFAYCISMMMILIAADYYSKKDIKTIAIASVIYFSLLAIDYLNYRSHLYLVVNIVFVILAILIAFKYKKLLLIFVCFELTINTWVIYDSISRYTVFTQYENYSDISIHDNIMSKVLSEVNLTENQRLESNINRTNNESIGYGYGSLSYFSSSYNALASEFLYQYGQSPAFLGTDNYGASLFVESLLGVKYGISYNDDTINATNYSHYQLLNQNEEISIYENKYALPIAFVVDEVEDILRPYDHSILNQNELAYELGAKGDLFVAHEDKEFFGHNIDVASVKPYVVQKQDVPNDLSEVIFELVFEPEQVNQQVFLELPNEMLSNTIEVAVNRVGLGNFTLSSESGVISLGTVDETLQMKVEIILKESYVEFDDANFYLFDYDVYEALMQDLHSQPQVDYERSLDTITMNVENEYAQDLIVTYPYDEGWQCTVNGESVEIELFEETFIKVSLNEGSNEIVLSYMPVGLKAGLIISLVSFAIIGFVLIKRKRTCIKVE